MSQENTPYGADGGYHLPVPGMLGGEDTDYVDGPYHFDAPVRTKARDTFFRQEEVPHPSSALEVDRGPISEAVHTRVIDVAGVALSA